MTKIQLAGAAMTVLLAGSLAGCAPPPQAAKNPAVDSAKVADAVMADATQRIADVNAHDAAKFAGHYAADGISMFHGRPNAVGPAAIQASFQKSLTATPDLQVTMSDPTVVAAGDRAVFRATTTATSTDPKTKRSATTTNNSLSGYERQADGSWKIEWSVVSDTSPAPEPATKG